MFFTVLSKEAKQLFRDKVVLLVALLQPIIFIVVFGSSFQGGGDIKNIDTVIIDYDNTIYSKYVIETVRNTDFFEVRGIFEEGLDEQLKRVNGSEIRAAVFIPKGFGEAIDDGRTANLEYYLDSSDFMVYKTLAAAQGLIIKGSLQNITSDILGELESEKEEGKEKIDKVKSIFEEIRTESIKLERDINKSKDEAGDYSFDELDRLLNGLKGSLSDQINSIGDTQRGLGELAVAINSIQTEEVEKKTYIVGQIDQMINAFNQSAEDARDLREDVEGVDVGDSINSSLQNSINDRLEYMRGRFNEADELSKSINFDLEKLKSNFLSEPIHLEEIQTFGEIKYFDYLGAGILSLIIFFIGLMTSAINIISEKENNTLYRISTTPTSGFSLFLGKFTLFIIFGFIELIYTVILAITLYDLRIDGSVYHALLILFLLSCSAISIGLFISANVKSIQQSLLVIPLLVIPSFLISNSFFPKDMLPDFMYYVSFISPMTFSNHALREIMLKGTHISVLMNDVYALLWYTLVPLLLFVWSYRKVKY